MKWQDFYFEWLEKIGYYDWFNATLVGYKTPYPVGGRTNIGTVGFGGTGEPPIQDVPYVPTYTHPAQSLIESQLADTGVLTDLDAGLRGYGGRNFSGMFTTPVNQRLSTTGFGTAQKNTLRYWGYQPSGQTFSASSNFYRGYAYHSNAMKQKKELRGRRGDVLIRDSKKSWFTDKKNRTYPSLRKNQSVPMVGIRHTDYSHYGDVGNLMEIAWGSMNGLSYSYNDANAATEEANLEDLESQIALLNESDYEAGAFPLSNTLARGVGINLQLNGMNTEEYISQQASMRMPTDEDMRKINEINGFISQKYLDNKGVIVRNKKFRETDYVKDKIRYDARQQISNLLLGIDSQMSVTTAEIILQILANPMLGINRQGQIEGGPIQLEIDAFMDEFIPRDTQIKIQELLIMHGPQRIPTNGAHNHTPNKPITYIGSFYLGIPMNKLQFARPNQITGSNDTFTWRWNESNVQQKFQTTRLAGQTRGCTGYEELFSNQNTAAVAREVMGLWQDLEIVDDSIMPLIDTILEYLPNIESSNYALEKYANLHWLYSLPTWVNPNYAIAIANSEIQNAASVDWQPKDIGFMINGQEQYMYDVKLSDWVQDFMNQEPDMSNQKYWAISMLFNQPITKKSRGSTAREILGLHQIVLDLSPTLDRSNVSKNKMVSNNLGMIACDASQEQWRGELNSNDELISITYDFFSDVVEWPYYLKLPGWQQQNTLNEQGLGEMQSYLTPMDDDTDWWNLFLDNDTGILSLDTTMENNSIPEYDGWFIGWDFGYMDSIIQKAKAMGKPWAENLTLESFCKKVYPSETLKVHFYPKQDYTDMLESQVADAANVAYGARLPGVASTGEGLFNNKNAANNFFSFTPFETRYADSRNVSTQDTTRVRYNRPNELGGAAHMRNETTNRWLAILNNPNIGFTSIEDWTNFIDNDEGYLPTLQPATLRPNNRYAAFNSSAFRNGRLNGVVEAGGLEPLPKINPDENAFTIMFQESGGIVAIPKYDPVVKSWTDEAWEGLNAATGYSNINAALTGNIISMQHEARGDSYNPTFRSVAKCIINEEMPSDILEVEEMPESFVGRNIDYTMPSGTPWRRGKIFMINWVAILTPSILNMLSPDSDPLDPSRVIP